jgi:hypothetical protein
MVSGPQNEIFGRLFTSGTVGESRSDVEWHRFPGLTFRLFVCWTADRRPWRWSLVGFTCLYPDPVHLTPEIADRQDSVIFDPVALPDHAIRGDALLLVNEDAQPNRAFDLRKGEGPRQILRESDGTGGAGNEIRLGWSDRAVSGHGEDGAKPHGPARRGGLEYEIEEIGGGAEIAYVVVDDCSWRSSIQRVAQAVAVPPGGSLTSLLSDSHGPTPVICISVASGKSAAQPLVDRFVRRAA